MNINQLFTCTTDLKSTSAAAITKGTSTTIPIYDRLGNSRHQSFLSPTSNTTSSYSTEQQEQHLEDWETVDINKFSTPQQH
jgi:hypothetical protein